MKTFRLSFLALFLLASISLFSQTTNTLQIPTSLNTDGSPPDGSAILHVQDTTRGMLIPRMTTAQRTAIGSPATGLLVFDTTTKGFWFFDGSAWTDLSKPDRLVDADGDTGIRAEFTPDEDRLRFRVSNINAMVIDTSGKIGIGVPAPTEQLDVAGTVRTDGFTLPTGAMQGHVLKSNANGQAAWQPLFPASFIPEPEPYIRNTFGVGSGTYDIAVQGNYAYLVDVNDDDLKVINISDPDNLSISGDLTIGAAPVSVAVQGNYAYVADSGSDDLKVINVSDPANPSPSGSLLLGNSPRVVKVQGNLACVIDNVDGNLTTVNVTNPNNPSLLGNISLGTTPWAMAFEGNYAYTLDLSDDSLHIIDVSNPVNPSIVGRLKTGNSPIDVAVQGNFAYVLTNTTSTMEVIDVSDPANPSLVGSLGVPTGVAGITLQGNYAFVINFVSFELKVIDISNPATPMLVTSLGFGSEPEEIAVQGDFVYIMDIDSKELKIVQLSGANAVGLDLNGELATNSLGWVKSGNNLQNTNSGNVGIGRPPTTNRLEVEGSASKSTAGDWLANSDARLKTNIRPLDSEDILRKMLALRGITYEWDDDKTGADRPKGTQYGFTAQNIREVFPELVSEDNLGYLQTAYGTYDAMTVEAIRALQNQIDELRRENRALKMQNNRVSDEQKDLKEENEQLTVRLAKLEAAVFGTIEKVEKTGAED